MNSAVQKAANAIYGRARSQSAKTMRNERRDFAHTLATRRSHSNLPLSGPEFQAVLKISGQHIERCIQSRFDSYRQAFAGAQIDPSNQDYIPLQVMNSILGGSFGSRITSNIREQKGYTYSPNSQISPRYRDAYWLQVADVTAQHTGDSIKEILYEIDRLQKEPPGAAELNGIKNFLAGVFVLRNSSRAGLIGQLEFVDLHKLGDDYLNNYVQKIYAVTPQQVEQAAQKYIDAQKLTMVVVGDKQKVAEQVAPYQGTGM